MTWVSKLGGAFANHPAVDSLGREHPEGPCRSRLGRVAVGETWSCPLLV